MIYMYKKLCFNDLGDERGKLVVIEGNIDIPFTIQRAFYMTLIFHPPSANIVPRPFPDSGGANRKIVRKAKSDQTRQRMMNKGHPAAGCSRQG